MIIFKLMGISKNHSIDLINSDPEILIHKNFLHSSQCKNLIKSAKPKLKRALVEDENGVRVSKGRTNKTSFLDKNDSKEIQYIEDYLLKNYSVRPNNLTRMQVLKYKKNDKYVPHFDGYEKNLIKSKFGKQRFLTFIIYLSDDFVGGETAFPLLDINIKPTTGDLLIFRNCFNSTNFIHPKALHESTPVRKGEKWALNFWSYKDLDLNNL